MTGEQLTIILVVIGAVQALCFLILRVRLENTIKFEFRKREQAAMVASLFSEWMGGSEDTKKLNRLAWEATLWLPDKIATEVNKRLQNKPDAKDAKEILVDVKALIHGRKSTLKPLDITHYPK